MLQVELKVLEGRQAGKTIPLQARQFLIGREQDCHLRPNSDLVSRHHCVFTVDDFSVRLRDLGSTNGTYVNGSRIENPVVLKAGDKVSVGKLAFEIVIVQRVAAPAAAAPAAPLPLAVFNTPAAEEIDTAVDNSATVEFAPLTAPEDTTVYGEGPLTGGMPVALPPGYAPAGYPGMPYGMPQQGYPMPGYPQGYGMQGYPPPGYPAGFQVPGYPGQPGYPQQPAGYPQQAGYLPPGAYMPGYAMPGMMPGYGAVPGMATEIPAEEPSEGVKAQSEAPPVQLPDPESTGVKAPPPPPPAPPTDPNAPAAPPARKPSEAAADIIRNQRLRRG